MALDCLIPRLEVTMKKLLLLSSLLLALAAPAAHAGLDLSWSACNLAPTPGTGGLSFDCSSPKYIADRKSVV